MAKFSGYNSEYKLALEKIRLNLKMRKWVITFFVVFTILNKLFLGVNLSWLLIGLVGWMAFSSFVYDYLLTRRIALYKPARLEPYYFFYMSFDVFVMAAIIFLLGGLGWIGFIFYMYYLVFIYEFYGPRFISFFITFLVVLNIIIVSLVDYFGLVPHFYIFTEVEPVQAYANFKFVYFSIAILISSFLWLAYYASVPANWLRKRNDDLKSVREELEQVNIRLKALDKVKSEFLSMAAHQLRTPLAAIKWSLSMFKDSAKRQLDNSQIAMLDKAYRANERLVNLVNDLLNVSRIEEGRMSYELERINLVDFLDKTSKDFCPQCDAIGVKFSFKGVPEGKEYFANLDKEKFRLALQNIVDNAIRYNRPGGRVDIAVEEEKDFYRIIVADTGIGIPSEQQSQLFEKFFRASNARKTDIEGTGLGLFIAKAIVKEHGGEISFTSKEGQGTTFVISLPKEEKKEDKEDK